MNRLIRDIVEAAAVVGAVVGAALLAGPMGLLVASLAVVAAVEATSGR